MPRVFISYRRDNSEPVVRTIREHLASLYGAANVVAGTDMAPTRAGLRDVLREADRCDALLAVIGDRWLDIVTPRGSRGLGDPRDHVRLEIESALACGIPVIPVLVGTARMPEPTDLPEPLRPLAGMRPVPVRSGPSLRQDVDCLARQIEELEPRSPAEPETREDAPRVYVCYRRDDSALAADRIHGVLAEKLGRESVFTDTDAVPPGSDFREVLRLAIDRCDVCLVVIGDRWLERDSSGKRRLDDPADFIRVEIELVFARGAAVIPVIVGGRGMPAPEELPEALRPLAYRQAVSVRPGRDFDRDVERLAAAIRACGAAAGPGSATAEVAAGTAGPAPPPPSEDEYDVFISYRRRDGSQTARLIASEFRQRGFRPYLDVEGLGPGCFDEELLRQVEAIRNFALVLSPGGLDACREDDDWLRREIAHAINTARNIIPIMMPGFVFPPSRDLPEDIRRIRKHQSVSYSHEFFGAMMDRIVEYLR